MNAARNVHLRHRDDGAGTAPSDTKLAQSKQERLCKNNKKPESLRSH